MFVSFQNKNLQKLKLKSVIWQFRYPTSWMRERQVFTSVVTVRNGIQESWKKFIQEKKVWITLSFRLWVVSTWVLAIKKTLKNKSNLLIFESPSSTDHFPISKSMKETLKFQQYFFHSWPHNLNFFTEFLWIL